VTVKDGAAGPIAQRLVLDGHEHGGKLHWSGKSFPAVRANDDNSTIPRGARHQRTQVAPQPCIRSIREDRDHDAVMRIGRRSSEAAGPFFTAAWKPWV
jgi:hypothetical protein